MSPLYIVIHEMQMQMELCRCYCCWERSCYFFCSFFLSWHLLSLNPHWNRLMMIKLMKHLFCPNSNQSVVAVALHCLDLRSALPMPSFLRFCIFQFRQISSKNWDCLWLYSVKTFFCPYWEI